MSTVEQAADEIAAELNQLDWSLAIEATNPDEPTLKPTIHAEDADTVSVQVYPHGLERERISRNAYRYTVVLSVLVIRQLTGAVTRRVMNGLVEELVDAAELMRPCGYSYEGTEVVSLYDDQFGKETGGFASLHRLSYVAEVLR